MSIAATAISHTEGNIVSVLVILSVLFGWGQLFLEPKHGWMAAVCAFAMIAAVVVLIVMTP